MALGTAIKNVARGAKNEGKYLRNRRVSANPTARERYKLSDGEARMRNTNIKEMGTRHLGASGPSLEQRLANYKQAKAAGVKKGSFEYNGRKNVLDRPDANGRASILHTTRTEPVRTRGQASSPVRTEGKASPSVPMKGQATDRVPTKGIGGAPDYSATHAEQFQKTMRKFGQNIAENVPGGKVSNHLMRTAGQGAVWGGVAGGTLSAAQGGDFWEGAKEGAFKGAVGYTGLKTAKIATGAQRYRDIPSNAKEIWGHHAVSKQVKAIKNLHQSTANSPTKM